MTTTEQLTLDLPVAVDAPADVVFYRNGEKLPTVIHCYSWDEAEVARSVFVKGSGDVVVPDVTWEAVPRPTGWFGTKQEEDHLAVYEAVIQRP